MDILLINPNREHVPWPAMPLGLCMVASALRRAGHDVSLLDLAFSTDPYRETTAALRRGTPSVVGVTIRNIDNCNFERPVFYLTEIRDGVLRAIRENAAAAPIVIGGSGVSVAPWEVLNYLRADYALVGEGEEALPAFLAALGRGDASAGDYGVLTRQGPSASVDTAVALNEVRTLEHEPRGGRSRLANLDSGAQSEAWRWLDLRRYATHGAPYSVQTKRGCALRCVYCVYNNIEGRRYRLRAPAAVADEIEYVVRAHGIKRVDFVDSTFNLPLAHALGVCEELAVRALPVRLSTMGINPAATSTALLNLMRRAGFDSVMCSAESASDVTLGSLQKGYRKEAVIHAAEQLRRAGLKVFWFFIFGAPGETLDTVGETLAFCERYVQATDVALFTTGIRVYPGTPLEQQLKRSGWFDANDPLLWPSWYVSPTIDLQQLYGLLVRAAARHPNWMTNAETIVHPTLALAIKRGFELVGWRGPFWTHLPKLFTLATHLGTRQRNLEANVARMRAIRNVPHRSGPVGGGVA
ncbi:MAG: cobalamin-dependent protein [Deltaproteobacteria bacterium]|nr:cobalamin-dependent protein [Deltaproteobacteria bacterium]